jgi:N-acetylmuramoyl-L-alanine amidase
MNMVLNPCPPILTRASKVRYYRRKRGETMAKVVIDPGHGGPDPGAVWKRNEPTEKEINLDIAKKARDFLKAKRVEVVMTRDKDEEVELKKRVEEANKPNVSCLVSIHTNSAISTKAKGFEVYYHPDSSESMRLANALSVEYRKILPSVAFRGIKPTRYLYVIRRSRPPAVLIEVGFISSEEDRKILYDPEQRGSIALAIANGISSWLRAKERRRIGRCQETVKDRTFRG